MENEDEKYPDLTLVLLDIGHGPNTPGKRSPEPYLGYHKENAYAALIAKKIHCGVLYHELDLSSAIINSNAGCDCEMSLRDRVKYANDKIDYFGKKNSMGMSIHVNASRAKGWQTTATGARFFYHPFSKVGKKLAVEMTKQMEKIGSNVRPPKPALFYMLRKTKCPWVYAELGFQDNKNDVKYLMDNQYQIARALRHVISKIMS